MAARLLTPKRGLSRRMLLLAVAAVVLGVGFVVYRSTAATGSFSAVWQLNRPMLYSNSYIRGPSYTVSLTRPERLSVCAKLDATRRNPFSARLIYGGTLRVSAFVNGMSTDFEDFDFNRLRNGQACYQGALLPAGRYRLQPALRVATRGGRVYVATVTTATRPEQVARPVPQPIRDIDQGGFGYSWQPGVVHHSADYRRGPTHTISSSRSFEVTICAYPHLTGSRAQAEPASTGMVTIASFVNGQIYGERRFEAANLTQPVCHSRQLLAGIYRLQPGLRVVDENGVANFSHILIRAAQPRQATNLQEID